ncbi:hypothetical protein FSP39_023064 [Pinctada imbricata]|uniref:Uncharacterized protein n=1 Tax=Pinctada imbricata TaxID=66713 RepID=A0AA88YL70_PINIB|nr:hypothetical protein FSP39_023064 [Pinctada imbricata]
MLVSPAKQLILGDGSHGSKLLLFSWFNKIGWCVSKWSARRLADKLCEEYDRDILQWKEEIEVEFFINFHFSEDPYDQTFNKTI